jgi:hypothetical protein
MQYNQSGSTRGIVVTIYVIVVRLSLFRNLHSSSDNPCFSEDFLKCDLAL